MDAEGLFKAHPALPLLHAALTLDPLASNLSTRIPSLFMNGCGGPLQPHPALPLLHAALTLDPHASNSGVTSRPASLHY